MIRHLDLLPVFGRSYFNDVNVSTRLGTCLKTIRAHLVVVLSAVSIAFGGQERILQGRIKLGLDTLDYFYEYGFDFLAERACTTRSYSPTEGCYQHLQVNFQSADRTYNLRTEGGYGMSLGKLNFDSVSEAPSDSLLHEQHYGRFGIIPEDSVEEYLGTVWVFKTGEDPRREYPFRAKVKLLDLQISPMDPDSFDFIFLWAANVSGWGDLTTADMDTFNFEGPTVVAGGIPPAYRRQGNAVNGRRMGLVMQGHGLGLPGRLPDAAEQVHLFDLRGRAVKPLRGRIVGTMGAGVYLWKAGK